VTYREVNRFAVENRGIAVREVRHNLKEDGARRSEGGPAAR
jgi:hypothetical protein